MQADQIAERITPANHALAGDRLESTLINLRSPSPPERFDPARFRGIEALNVAVANLQTQKRVNEILGLVTGRKEAAERAAVLKKTDPERLDGPVVFDEFRAGDFIHLLYIYYSLHHRVDGWLEGDAIPNDKIQALGRVMFDKLPPADEILSSSPILAQRNNSAIAKTQTWLDNPKMHETMDRLIPESNTDNGEDVWDFIDSLVSLNRTLGGRSINLRIFIEQYTDKFGSQGFPFDIRNADWTKKVDVSANKPEDTVGNQAGNTGPVIIEPLVSKPKAVERRDPDIREALNKYLDQVLEKPELAISASPGTVTRAFPKLKENTIDDYLEQGYIRSGQARRLDHDRFDPAAIAAMLYLYEHEKGSLSSRLRRQVQDIAIEEWEKKQKKATQ